MKPTARLMRHRLAKAYGIVFSAAGLPMLASSVLVASAAIAIVSHPDALHQQLGPVWAPIAQVITGAFGLAYCIPWGVFSRTVEPAEVPYV